MSLIHEALKKAQREQGGSQIPSGPQVNPIIGNSKKPEPVRLIILGAVLAVSIGFLIYLRFLRAPQATQTPVPAPLATLPTPQGQNDVALRERALKFFEEKRFDESAILWQQLTLLTPTDGEVYNNLGLSYKKLGKTKEAMEAYAKALALNKDYPEALNNAGVLWMEQGDKQKAKIHFQQAVEKKPEYAEVHLNFGLLLEQEGNFGGALEHYRRFDLLAASVEESVKQTVREKIKKLETR